MKVCKLYGVGDDGDIHISIRLSAKVIRSAKGVNPEIFYGGKVVKAADTIRELLKIFAPESE